MSLAKSLGAFCVGVCVFGIGPAEAAHPVKAAKAVKPAPSRESVVNVWVVADPVHYIGRCPGVVRFIGNVEVTGPTTISYRWERSDGVLTPVQTLAVRGRKTTVETTWRVGTPKKAVRGSLRLRVFEPGDVYSRDTSFMVACGGAVDPSAGGRRPDD